MERISPRRNARRSAAARLAALFDRYRDAQMGMRPLSATCARYRGYDERLEDLSAGGRRRERDVLTALRRALDALGVDGLPEGERLSCAALRWQIDRRLELQQQRFEQWGGFFGAGVDPMEGLQSSIPFTVELAQPMQDEAGARALLRRVEAMPRAFREHIANLRCGLDAGRVATRKPVEKTIAQLETMLTGSAEQTPYAAAARRLPAKLRARWEPKISAAVARCAFAAYRSYAQFLNDEYLARSRPEEKAGVCHLPGGEAAYARLVRFHTTLELEPKQIHEIGLSELRVIHEELRAVARGMGFNRDVREFLDWVRQDPKNFFRTRGEMLLCAKELVRKTYERLPAFFGRLPQTPLEVKKVEEYKEKNAVGASYIEPPQDLSRPGIYYLNTYEPRTRQRFTMASLTAHEGVPGHHLQLALAAENPELPAFRRYADSYWGSAAFIEGWALYSERLADEMGLYRDDLSRVGMLSDQAFRACRLVVDTGLHALGWTRRQAVDFMKLNTPMDEASIVTEIDRYTVWPAQALAYKLGQREISGLRRELETRLGAAFDIRAFHDALLGNGALPLPAICDYVRRSLGA